jgi:hypothetical protein
VDLNEALCTKENVVGNDMACDTFLILVASLKGAEILEISEPTKRSKKSLLFRIHLMF